MIFRDLEQTENPITGARLESAAAVAKVFESVRNREPFLLELGKGSVMLTVGFAGDLRLRLREEVRCPGTAC